jgi:hypothetical protein
MEHKETLEERLYMVAKADTSPSEGVDYSDRTHLLRGWTLFGHYSYYGEGQFFILALFYFSDLTLWAVWARVDVRL